MVPNTITRLMCVL